MLVAALNPAVTTCTEFHWSHHKGVPDEPGCYVIAAFDQTVLYVGLASKSLRGRMGNHLDDPIKRKGASGRLPYWFHYLPLLASEVQAVERGWINQSILDDGQLPPLNRVHSPI